jgi:hypothetical protein
MYWQTLTYVSQELLKDCGCITKRGETDLLKENKIVTDNSEINKESKRKTKKKCINTSSNNKKEDSEVSMFSSPANPISALKDVSISTSVEKFKIVENKEKKKTKKEKNKIKKIDEDLKIGYDSKKMNIYSLLMDNEIKK